MIRNRILITGLGGALGSELAGRLAGLADNLRRDVELVATFSSRQSRERFLLRTDPRLRGRLRAAVCDLANEGTVQLFAAALRPVERTVILHAAGSTSWTLPRDQAMRANVQTTANVVRLARLTSKQTQMIYVSTAHTAPSGWAYRNAYEASKAAAERMLRTECSDVELSTFSCGLVVGHSRTGAIARFHGLYPLLRLLECYQIPALPARPDRRLDIVPVDWVADELFGQLVAVWRGAEPGDVVAAAGDRAPLVPDLIETVVATLNRRRRADGRPVLPDVALLGTRRWEFLRRTVTTWNAADTPMPRMRELNLVLDAYRPYLEDDRVLPPRGTSSPAPAARGYLDRVVTFWLDRIGRGVRLDQAA